MDRHFKNPVLSQQVPQLSLVKMAFGFKRVFDDFANYITVKALEAGSHVVQFGAQ